MGPLASEAGVQALREKMHLNSPLPEQYAIYLAGILEGDLGRSWTSGTNVADDVAKKLPATLELMTFGLLFMLFVLLPVGAVTAARGGGIINRILKRVTFVYGLLSGALPDFWLGLLFLFLFFTLLGWVPGPRRSALDRRHRTAAGDRLLHHRFAPRGSGRYVPGCRGPPPVAGPDPGPGLWWSDIQDDPPDGGPSAPQPLHRLPGRLGVPHDQVLRVALRNSAPPIIVMTGIIVGFLLGGAVLIETVFNLNGIGQYAVKAVTSADYAPMQAFVLIAAIFTMLVYLVVDLLYFLVDPRVRTRRTR